MGRQPLCRTLSALDAGAGGHGVISARGRVTLAEVDSTTDVRRLAALLAETGGHGRPRSTVCGDFMAGFALRDANGFAEWPSAQVEQPEVHEPESRELVNR